MDSRVRESNMYRIVCECGIKLGFSGTCYWPKYAQIHLYLLNVNNCILHRNKKQKAKEYQKHLYMCFIDYTEAFNGVDYDKFWNRLKELEISPHHIQLISHCILTRQLL